VPGFSDWSSAIDKIIRRLLLSDQRAALMMRGILLSANKPEDLNYAIQKEAHVGKEMLLNKLAFMSRDVCVSFLGKLDGLLDEAASLWNNIQYLEQIVKVGNVGVEDAEFYDWEWLYVERFGQPPPGHPEDIVGLFPAFYLPEEDLEVHPGYAIWKGQDQIKTAHKEWKEFQKSKAKGHVFNLNTRTAPGGHRRKGSSSMNGGAGIAMSPPTSPNLGRVPNYGGNVPGGGGQS